MYIDSHCHLSLEDFENIKEYMKEVKNNHVNKIILSLCSREDLHNLFSLAILQDSIYLTIGYHPEEADYTQEKDITFLKELLKNPKVIGIGEIGLDYHYTKENKIAQQKLFEEQLKLAEQENLPVVIHSRDATNDTIEILKKYHVKGVIHCFSGSLETAKQYIKMGFFLGIGGVVTFKNSKLPDVIREVPLECLVLETDSPYLTPEPYRGHKNSPQYIPVIAQKIADIKNVSVEEVVSITSQNIKKIYHI